MTASWWYWGALSALGVFLPVFSLQLSASGLSNPSHELFRKTTIGKNIDIRVNCSDTFDVATGDIIVNEFLFPNSNVRKFHSVYTIPDGAMSFDRDDYHHVLTANMTHIVERSGFWFAGQVSPMRNLSKPIIKLHGDVLFLKVACHYWHYQHESIIQLLMLQQSGELTRLLTKKSNSTLLLNAPLDCGSPNIFGSMLTYFGFDGLLNKMDVRLIDRTVTYQAVGGDLVMTANGCYHPNLDFLDHAAKLSAKERHQLQQKDAVSLQGAPPPPPSRLYIDREVTYKRGIINREELLAGLATFNFTLFSPASHSFTEQREAFARASLILSPSGTAFSANIIHCDPKTTILIEMFGKPIHTRTGIIVAASMKARHYYAVQPDYNHNATTGDFYVNVSMVMKVVQTALKEQQMNIMRTALNNYPGEGNIFV